MLINALIRVSSVLIVAAMVRYTSTATFNSLFIFLVLGHYFVGFIYSKNRMREIIRQPKSYLPGLLLLVGGAFLTLYKFPIWIYFGVHHMLSEVYQINSHKLTPENRPLMFLASSFLLNGFGYLLIIRNERVMPWVSLHFIAFIFLVSTGIFFYYLFRSRNIFSRALLFDQGLFESVNVLVVLGSIFFRVNYREILMYHIISWFFLPLSKMKTKSSLLTYLILTVAVSGGFWLLSPFGGLPFQVPLRDLSNQVDFWGYVHFTASFALSSSNPKWITKWFSNRQTNSLQTKQDALLPRALVN